MDERAQKMKSGLQLLKVVRGVFLLGGVAFALAALGLAYKEFDDGNAAQALGIALIGILFGSVLAAGAWFVVSRFMESASEGMIRTFGPQFEQDLTDQTGHWDAVAANSVASTEDASSEAELDFTVELTATVVADDVEETLTVTAAHLFTRDDLRGNVDLVVSALPGNSPDSLTEALLQRLQLEFEGRRTRLSSLAHEANDPDGSFLIVLCYSIADLIEEFEFDRPRLEQWINELATFSGTVRIYWDERFLGSVRLVIAD